ncbi:MAG: glycosyl transferase [Clostridia bacterium]|nr:glycosyl transferase [Clostridia bacterium]
MIPKKIHYCWFGFAEKPKLARKCIESWEKYCPDYEIIEWNESNYDITKNKYMYDAYKSKKWAFVSDYARLDLVYTYGGIYLDTDVELLKPWDDLLDKKGFAGVEIPGIVALGLGFGAEAGNPTIKSMLDQYESLSFFSENGKMNLTPCPIYQSMVLKELGLKSDNSVHYVTDQLLVYSKDYFNPMDMTTHKVIISPNSYSIHWYAGSWVSKKDKIKTRVARILRRVLSEESYNKLKRFIKGKHK